MGMSVQPVRFFPVPPVKPIAYPRPEAPAEDRKVQARAPTPSHLGRNVDVRV
jgi:hypothetical protein